MSYDLNLIRGAFRQVSAGALTVLLLTSAPVAFAASNERGPTQPYTWSAALVEHDATNNIVTLRSMFATHVDGTHAEQFEPGEEVYLTWSGLHWANGVRAINRRAEDAPATLTLPVRFEGLENDGRYVTFSLEIPAEHSAKLGALLPGHWVTATSPRFPFDSQEAVIDIRPYNDVD